MASTKEKDICKKKVRFSSYVAAQSALKKINPNRALKKPSRLYRCSVCSGWHLSSQP